MGGEVGLGLGDRIGAEMEDRGGEHGAGMALFHALDQVVERADAARGDHRHMHFIGNGTGQFEVEADAGAVAIHRGDQKLAGAALDHLGGELDGIRILKPETIAAGLKLRSKFYDPFVVEPMAYGTVFAVQTEQGRFGPAPDAFGHSGAGGSIHGGWPSTGTGFSYTMNQMRIDPEDIRSRYVLKALYEAVTGSEGSGNSGFLGFWRNP